MVLPEDYLKYLRENVSTLERIGDKFSGADERLDFILREIRSLPLADIPLLKASIESLTSALRTAGIEVEMPGEIREIRIEQNVLPTQGVILRQEPPFDGYIKEVIIHWPSGCAGLVSVRVGYRTKQFLPFEGFLALDNVAPTYSFNEHVQHTEDIFVEIQNTDAVNAHRITVMLNIWERVSGNS